MSNATFFMLCFVMGAISLIVENVEAGLLHGNSNVGFLLWCAFNFVYCLWLSSQRDQY